MARRPAVNHTVTVGEVWTRKRGAQFVQVSKDTVRVAKGAVGGNRPGTFQGATNLRGTERDL